MPNTFYENKKIFIPKNILMEEYINKGKSLRQIAREMGYSYKVIRSRIKEYGIDIRPKHEDMTNKKYGLLKVIERVGTNNTGSPIYKCICKCGKIIKVITSNLVEQYSCGCSSKLAKIYYDYKDISGSYWNITIKSAMSRNIEFSITIDDVWNQYLKQNKKCAISGKSIIFDLKYYKHNKQTASIDRIDSNKGYTKDNIQIVHKHINRMKFQFCQSQFIDMCYDVYFHQNLKKLDIDLIY